MSDKQARETQAATRARGHAQRMEVQHVAAGHRGLLAAFYAKRRAAQADKSS